jgi:hypothetical protein
MKNISNKSWTDPEITPSKKYLSRMFTHKLSGLIDHRDYEVVFEMPFNKDTDNVPDVVVFDKRRGWSSVMAIEICRKDEVQDLLIVARDLMEKYSLLDFYLFDQDSFAWYNVKRNSLGYEIIADSAFPDVSGVYLQHTK